MKYYRAVPEFIEGDPWTICQACSKQIRASDMIKRWDGLFVCDSDYRKPQPEFQPRPFFPGEGQAFTNTMPYPTETYITYSQNKSQYWTFSPIIQRLP